MLVFILIAREVCFLVKMGELQLLPPKLPSGDHIGNPEDLPTFVCSQN